MDTMYIAINKATQAKETFTWSPNDELLIAGVPADPNDWDIVEIEFKIITG